MQEGIFELTFYYFVGTTMEVVYVPVIRKMVPKLLDEDNVELTGPLTREEYVGAKGNTLVDHKKRKYKKGIKDIET